ncbi:MAG: ISAs1 family transposase, partial [Cyanobacteria bacterium J06639_1]
MRSTLKKTCRQIVESQNHCLAALKGNHPHLYESVIDPFVVEQESVELSKGYGRIERRCTQVWKPKAGQLKWPGLRMVVRVQTRRRQRGAGDEQVSDRERYFICSCVESAAQVGRRIRQYWGVENRVHYVRDVTQGENRSRIRTSPLVQTYALARNVALNRYREHGFSNMAQAQRRCS